MLAWFLLPLATAGDLHLCAHEDVSACRSNCEADHALSCARYAHQLTYGVYDRLDKDREEAGKIWKKSCELGWAAGCNRLGMLYDQGKDGFPQDTAKANSLFEKACAMDDPSACWNHGVSFDDAGNLAKAKALYEKACQLGHSDACIEVGAMYEVGDGVAKDWDKMWDHYARAFFAPSETKTKVVGCPEGTRTYRQEASFGWEIEVFCGRPGARRPTKHGPYLRWATEEDEAEGPPHGVITRRGSYTDGKKSGAWVYFDERGRKKKEGTFVADVEHGDWSKYDVETGRVRETIPYEQGKRVGAVEEATYSGGKRVGAYVDGKKDGKWVEYDENGDLHKVEFYAKGTKVGTWTTHYSGAKSHERPYDDQGRQHGIERDFNREGEVIGTTVWEHGKRNGPSERLNDDGKRVRLVTWVDGEARGPFEKWSWDGKHLLEKGTYNGETDWFTGEYTLWDDETYKKSQHGTYDADGEPIGTWTDWDYEGNKQVEYVYGKPGCLTAERRFRPNGKPASKGGYDECDRHGPWVVYHDNGKKEYEGTYDHGRRVGPWSFWSEDGKLYRKGTYNAEGYEEGPWTSWFSCGHKEAEGSYNDEGYKIGEWTEWTYDEPHDKEVWHYDDDGNRTQVK